MMARGEEEAGWRYSMKAQGGGDEGTGGGGGWRHSMKVRGGGGGWRHSITEGMEE